MPKPVHLNWIIDGKLAEYRALTSSEEIDYLKTQGIKALVRMTGGNQPAVTERMNVEGLDELHMPIVDFSAPTHGQIEAMVAFIDEYIVKGWPVAVSCGDDYNQSGTVLACYLVKEGMSAQEAITGIRQKRPGSIETPEQVRAVRTFARTRAGKKSEPRSSLKDIERT